MKAICHAAFALALLMGAAANAQPIDPKVQARIDRILKATPLIDGHNDIAEQLAENYQRSVEGLASGTDQRQPKPLMTDMARLHQGRVGGQFWSVYIDGTITGDAAIRTTLEQIDIVRRMIAAYPKDLEQASTADDIVRIHKAGRIASMMGVEGGRANRRLARRPAPILQSRRAVHDADPQPDHRMGGQRHRRSQI